jgi:hypothetical protein
MTHEPIIYFALAWRARGLVIERWSVEDQAWHRHSSAPNYRLLLDRAAAATYGEVTSPEGFEALRSLAQDEQERMTAKPVRNGLGWLANTPRYSTDTNIPAHEAGDYTTMPNEPKAKARPPLPTTPGNDTERYVFDRERIAAETLAAIERAQTEALAEAEAKARQSIMDGIGAERAKAILEAERPIMLDAAIAEAEQTYQDAVKAGSAADQLNAIRAKKALQLARSKLVWHPAEEVSRVDV